MRRAIGVILTIVMAVVVAVTVARAETGNIGGVGTNTVRTQGVVGK